MGYMTVLVTQKNVNHHFSDKACLELLGNSSILQKER